MAVKRRNKGLAGKKKTPARTKAVAKKTARKTAPKAAYFLKLEIKNIRCFGPRQSLDLSDGEGRPARWTLILGDNNVGKSTLLQSIVYMEPTKSLLGDVREFDLRYFTVARILKFGSEIKKKEIKSYIKLYISILDGIASKTKKTRLSSTSLILKKLK